MNDSEVLDRLIEYILRWQRCKSFTSNNVLLKETGVPMRCLPILRRVVKVLGLGWPQNETHIRRGGIRWNKDEARDLMKGGQGAARERLSRPNYQ